MRNRGKILLLSLLAGVFFSLSSCSVSSLTNNEVNKIQANLFLGLKNLKVLGISIGDIGKNWDWDLAEYRCTIIPKTKFYDKELN